MLMPMPPRVVSDISAIASCQFRMSWTQSSGGGLFTHGSSPNAPVESTPGSTSTGTGTSDPARDPAPEVVRLAGLDGRRGVLKTGNLKLIPAVGHAITNAKRDFRLEPAEGGFEEVCAFHHMATAMQFFRDLLGPEVFDDEPFGPLTIRVQDRTVSAQVGAFFPGQHMIRLADTPRPAARSGDICMHEFTHAVVHRIARLDDEFASPIAQDRKS